MEIQCCSSFRVITKISKWSRHNKCSSGPKMALLFQNPSTNEGLFCRKLWKIIFRSVRQALFLSTFSYFQISQNVFLHRRDLKKNILHGRSLKIDFISSVSIEYTKSISIILIGENCNDAKFASGNRTVTRSNFCPLNKFFDVINVGLHVGWWKCFCHFTSDYNGKVCILDNTFSWMEISVRNLQFTHRR